MEIELFELLNDASIDSIVFQVLENAGIEDDNEKYEDYKEAMRGVLSSMSIDLPDSKEDLDSLL